MQCISLQRGEGENPVIVLICEDKAFEIYDLKKLFGKKEQKKTF